MEGRGQKVGLSQCLGRARQTGCGCCPQPELPPPHPPARRHAAHAARAPVVPVGPGLDTRPVDRSTFVYYLS
eukprot:scaffold38486_cov75-Phaeocystis_antarctica.AAC.1